MKKEEKYFKICPHCGSLNVKIPPAGFDIKMTVRDYCEDCGNKGIFPEIEESKIEEFRKKLKKE
jgi:hypothetical protein